MQRKNRTDEIAFLNTIKEKITCNLQNIVRSLLDYTDVIYDKPFNAQKFNNLQHLLLLD